MRNFNNQLFICNYKFMKKLILIIIVLLLPYSIMAFTSKVDSLESELLTASGIVRIEILNELANIYRYINIDRGIEYAKEALNLSENLKYEDGKAKSLMHLGYLYSSISNYNEALDFCKQSLDIYKGIGNKIEIARGLNNIGSIFVNLGEYEKAIKKILESLEKYKDIDYKEGVIESLYRIGNIYYGLEEYDKAIDFYLDSYKIFQELPDKNNVTINPLIKMGGIYYYLNKHNKSLEYDLKALNLSKEIGKKFLIIGSLANVGDSYANLENFDKALEYNLKALKLAQEIGHLGYVSKCYNNLAWIYENSKDYDKAIEYNLRALNVRKQVGIKGSITSSLINTGRVCIKSNYFKDAVKYLQQALQIAQEIKAKKLMKKIYNYLSDLYFYQNNYKQAFEYLHLYSSIKDSIFNEESAKQLAKMQTKYETEKKEKEIVLLHKDNDIQKLEVEKQKLLQIRLVFIILIIVIFWIFIFYHYRSKQKLNRELEKLVAERTKELTEANIQLKEEISEREKLEAQLRISERLAGIGELAAGVAHEIRNPLAVISSTVQYFNSIYTDADKEMIELWDIINQSSEKVNRTITSLLEFSKPRELSLIEGDILNSILKVCALVETKCSIQKVQLIKKLPNKLPHILYDEQQIEGVILNLILNALAAMPEGGKLNINAESINREIEISISDTGVGIPEEYLQKVFNPFFTTKKSGTGLGLSLVHQVVSSHQGSINIDSKIGKGTCVILSFPVCSN